MIKVILWDVDGTLLDFGEAEKQAMRSCFAAFELGELTDAMLSRYSAINKKYWEALEKKEITKPQVLIGRYKEFFALEKIAFDKIEAFNDRYQLELGETVCFMDDAKTLLTKLKGKVAQYAVTNGTYTAQSKKLAKSGLDKIFDGIFISDKIGAEKPSKEFFEYVFTQIGPHKKEEILIVGDSLTSDIRGGNNAGICSCWYAPKGGALPEGMKATVIKNLWQVEALLQRKDIS